jgi:hypothetical protein
VKRVIYYLRDLVWPSVLAIGLVIASLGFLALDAVAIAQVLALVAIALAILSVRS